MDSLFHFIFSIIAGMALDIDRKYGLKTLIIFALIATLIDVDHICIVNGKISLCDRGIFHSILFAVFLPFLLFLLFYAYEKPKGKIRNQTLALLLMILLTGHLICDMLSGEKVRLFYPITEREFSIPTYRIAVEGKYLVNTPGIALLIYFLVLFLTKFIEDFIYFFERQHLKIKEAFRKSLKEGIFGEEG